MTSLLLSIYVLVWPVITAIVLAVIARGFIKEWAEARRSGRDLV